MSSSPSSPWIWDAARRSYCLWSAQEHAWVYQDGTRVPAVQSPAQNTAHQSSSHEQPRSPEVEQDATHAFHDPQQRRDSTSTGSANDLAYGIASMALGPDSRQPSAYAQNTYPPSSYQSSNYQDARHYTSSAPQYTAGASSSRSDGASVSFAANPLIRVPKQDVTQESLFRKGARAHGKIRGTPGKSEPLDGNFYIRRPGKKFFVVGKVFKILWPEAAGFTVDGITVLTDTRFQNEKFVTKIRWFVVVKEASANITSPIMTYNRQGVTKPGLSKWQHAIAYTSKEPELLPGEEPAEGEYGMMAAIQVKPKSRQEKLQKESRINFAKIYTVEHNVKVCEFGNVYEKHLGTLRKQWKYVLECDINGNKEELDDDEDEDEADDDDDEDDDGEEDEDDNHHPTHT